MTNVRARKREIRARMERTGETYMQDMRAIAAEKAAEEKEDGNGR